MTDELKKVTVKGRLLGGGIWKARENPNDADKMEYSACVVLEEGQEKKIEALRDAALKKEFGNTSLKGKEDHTLRYGDDEEYEHSFEKHFINPKCREDRPHAMKVRRNGTVKDTTMEEDLIYPGCNVAVSVSAYAYQGGKKFKAGVTLNLRALMFLSHNERLSDTVNDSEFDGFESDEEFEDNEDW